MRPSRTVAKAIHRLKRMRGIDRALEARDFSRVRVHGDIYSLYVPTKTELSLNQQRLVNMWGNALGATEYPVAKSIPDTQQVQQDTTKDAALNDEHESHEQEERSDELNSDDER